MLHISKMTFRNALKILTHLDKCRSLEVAENILGIETNGWKKENVLFPSTTPVCALPFWNAIFCCLLDLWISTQCIDKKSL